MDGMNALHAGRSRYAGGRRWNVSYERQDRLKALVLAVCAFLLYTATRTRHFGGDDTVFAIAVQRWLDVGALEPTFIHPHHLLYNPMVAGLSWLVRLVTGSVFVLDMGAAVSAAAAAAAAAGTYLVLRRHEVGDDSALMAAVTLILAGGVWKYATRMEVYTFAAAGVVVWLAAVADRHGSWRKEAVGFAAPWLGHSVLGLLVLPGAWLLRGRPRVLMAAILGGVVVPGAIVVGLLAGVRKVDGLAGVLEIFAGPGLGRWLSAPDPIGALRALHGLVIWQSYRGLPVYPPWVMWTFDMLGAIASAILGALLIWGIVVVLRDGSRVGRTALAGIAVLVPLWLVWDSGNTEHVVAAAPLFVVLVAVGASSIRRRVALAALVVVAVSMLVVNGLGSALLETQPHLSRVMMVADHVQRTVPDGGTLVTIGVDAELRLGLPYLASRHVVDLTSLVHSARRAGAPPTAAVERWLLMTADAQDPWMLEDPDSAAVTQWVGELGIPEGDWRRTRSRLSLGGEATLPADGVAIRSPVTLHRVEVSRIQ